MLIWGHSPGRLIQPPPSTATTTKNPEPPLNFLVSTKTEPCMGFPFTQVLHFVKLQTLAWIMLRFPQKSRMPVPRSYQLPLIIFYRISDAVEKMKKGAFMQKIRGGSLYKRMYKLDKNCRYITYLGSTKFSTTDRDTRGETMIWLFICG